MKIVEYNIETLYSPINGELIINKEELNHEATTLVGYWIDAAFENPFLKNDKLKEMWDSFECGFGNYDKFEDFLSSVDENWICFKMCNSGISCGHVTTWFILNLNL